MKLAAVCMDSQGHFTNEVDRFCSERWDRRVWSIKGKGGMDVPYIQNPTKNNRVKVPKFTLGVDTGKCFVYDRLRVQEPGPGYCHFPSNRMGYDRDYFKGLTAEKRVTTFKKGRATTAWVLKDTGFKRNEPLDMRNYAQAAMEILHVYPVSSGTEPQPVKRGRRQRQKGITE